MEEDRRGSDGRRVEKKKLSLEKGSTASNRNELLTLQQRKKSRNLVRTNAIQDERNKGGAQRPSGRVGKIRNMQTSGNLKYLNRVGKGRMKHTRTGE